jgi:hypothetical protein
MFDLVENQYDFSLNRQKWSISGFLGEISKILFGTATEHEVKTCKEQVEKLESEQRSFLAIIKRYKKMKID